MGGWWLLKDDFVMPSEEEIQRDLPPEMVCAYESMMAAQARLKYMGIVRHFNPYHVRTALDRSRQSKREGIRQLERMLLVQPWHVTSAFREGIETHSPLQLQGYADPSMRGEMWDITKGARSVWALFVLLFADVDPQCPCAPLPGPPWPTPSTSSDKAANANGATVPNWVCLWWDLIFAASTTCRPARCWKPLAAPRPRSRPTAGSASNLSVIDPFCLRKTRPMTLIPICTR